MYSLHSPTYPTASQSLSSFRHSTGLIAFVGPGVGPTPRSAGDCVLPLLELSVHPCCDVRFGGAVCDVSRLVDIHRC